ncbi:MAG: Voltage-gated potassium channel Kch [Candidatus Marinimicrobia bacterium]|nr:Voltage-gated potassium channel Kch [Candidatus Neomarinimicrobiota bacterium]
MKRFRQFFQVLKDHNFLKIFLGIFVIMFVGGTLALAFERAVNAQGFNNLWSAFWWALVTITTVGYGDTVPVSLGGRIVGVLVMFAGVSLVSLLTATISSIFVAQKIREGQGLEQIKFDDHIIICGWNVHAEKILDSLFRLRPMSDLQVILINDLQEERINDILYKYRDIELSFVRGDSTREVVLERANVTKAQAVIVVPDTMAVDSKTADERTVLTTLAIKGLSNQIRVIAFLQDRDNQNHLRRAEVDEIVVSDEFGGYLLAANVVEPGVPQSVRELLDPGTERNLHRRKAPKHLIGKPFEEVFRHYYEEEDEIAIGTYAEDETISIMDFLSSDTSALDAFIKRKLEGSGHSPEKEQLVKVNVKPPKDYTLQDKDWIIVIGQ